MRALEEVNAFRSTLNRGVIKYFSLYDGYYYSFHALEYGKSKEGYWDAEKNTEMTVEFLDVFDFLYNRDGEEVKKGIARCMFDWSSGHAKFPPDALNANRMNMKVGGDSANNEMRAMKLMQNYGSSNLLVPMAGEKEQQEGEWTCEADDGTFRTLRAGDMYYTVFRQEDVEEQAGPHFETHLQPEQWVGKNKGLQQMCWELGLIDNNGNVKVEGGNGVIDLVPGTIPGNQLTDEYGRTYYDLRSSLRHLIKSLPELRAQRSELQITIEAMGHMCRVVVNSSRRAKRCLS